MDDAGVVRRRERIGDLRGEIDRLFDRHPALGDDLRQRAAFDQLHDHVRQVVMAAHVVDRDDARMIEGRGGPRLAIEPGRGIGVAIESRRDELDRDLASKTGIARAIHVAHAAATERRDELVDADDHAWVEGQRDEHTSATAAVAPPRR